MKKSPRRHVAIVAMGIVLLLSAAAMCYPGGDADGVGAERQFYIESVRKVFSLANTQDAEQGSMGALVLRVAGPNGRIVACAAWDGKEPVLLDEGRGWEAGFSADLEGRSASFKLRCKPSEESGLKGGKYLLELSGEYAGGANVGYSFGLLIPAEACLASENGACAAMAVGETGQGTLTRYLAIVALDGTCRFKVILKGSFDEGEEGIEAVSTVVPGKEGGEAVLMRIAMTVVDTWNPEVALIMAESLAGLHKSPEIHAYGTADKATAKPGELIEYSYFLFNAGMEDAMGVRVDIPIPEGTALVVSTLRVTRGKLRILPSGKSVTLSESQSESCAADRWTGSLEWSLEGGILPGETVFIGFEVEI